MAAHAAAVLPGTGLQIAVQFRFIEYFETQVLSKRPYLRKDWCIEVVKNPGHFERQNHNRFRFWAAVPELGRVLLESHHT
jgi:hypothetical protein